jgi:hypothetical protein
MPTVVALGTIEPLPGVPAMRPGTSFATAHVSFLAACVIKCLQCIQYDFDDLRKSRWEMWTRYFENPEVGFADSGYNPSAIPSKGGFAGQYSPHRFPRSDQNKDWYRQLDESLRVLSIGCHVAAFPNVTKRALELMALKMPDYLPHEVGAGFVSREGALAYFSNFTPTRFVELFGDAPLTEAQHHQLVELDRQLGPMWQENEAFGRWWAFANGLRIAMARVY